MTMTHIYKTICKIPFQKFTAQVWEKQIIFLMHFEFMKNMFEVQTGADNDIYVVKCSDLLCLDSQFSSIIKHML